MDRPTTEPSAGPELPRLVPPCTSRGGFSLGREERLREAVLERDGHCCVDCGKPTNHTHHVLPRSRFGRKGKTVCWSMQNMLSICPRCHDGSHTTQARKKHMAKLRDTHGYEYDGYPWCEVLMKEGVGAG